jgi:hypothetical protein
LKGTEGLGLTEDSMKVFEDTELTEQRAATTGQVLVRMLAWCEEVLKE